MQEILKELNDKQYEAVVNTKGPCLVIAGAGSGKTKVLTHKIAYIMQEENAKLKAKASSAPASRPAYASATSEPSRANANVASASNYDILKRISRLEKEVFGKQIVE